jgi:hypothetical protein
MNPGTANNHRRTESGFDREFSDLMRKPRGIRVCDWDGQVRCPRCKRALALFEAKKMEEPTSGWIAAHTEYVQMDARLLDIPAYFIRQIKSSWQTMHITRLSDGRTAEKSRAQFISWVEGFAARCRFCA